jgi:uncharacterized protein (DUF433 family)
MEGLGRITIEPGKMGGQPCIRGHRFTVEHLLQGLVKVSVTVRDRIAGWFRGAGLARGGCPGVGVGNGV